jgi:hypothetical protein
VEERWDGMLSEISYFLILGKPLIMYLGIATFLCVGATALIAVLRRKAPRRIPFTLHHRFAVVSLILALVHGILGMSAYL